MREEGREGVDGLRERVSESDAGKGGGEEGRQVEGVGEDEVGNGGGDVVEVIDDSSLSLR